MGDNRRETRWDGGRERGRQGQLVRRKTKRDRDEDGDRRKERQRSLERLKQRGRNISKLTPSRLCHEPTYRYAKMRLGSFFF